MASCTGSSCPMGPRSPVTPSSSPPRPARDDAFAHLALERTGPDQLEIDPFGRTSVAGLNAAGDLVATAPAVVQALPPASARRSASHRTSRPGRGHDAARDRRRQQERTRQDANPVTFGFAGRRGPSCGSPRWFTSSSVRHASEWGRCLLRPYSQAFGSPRRVPAQRASPRSRCLSSVSSGRAAERSSCQRLRSWWGSAFRS